LRANGFSSLPWKLTAAGTGDRWSQLYPLAAVLAAYSVKIVYVNMMIVVYMLNIMIIAKYNICDILESIIPASSVSGLFFTRICC
jgi:hypothetical protein